MDRSVTNLAFRSLIVREQLGRHTRSEIDITVSLPCPVRNPVSLRLRESEIISAIIRVIYVAFLPSSVGDGLL